MNDREPANILRLVPTPDQRDPNAPPVSFKKAPYHYPCRFHPNIDVDEETQLVFCRDCKTWMSAFNWLMNYAKEGEHIHFGLQNAKEALREKEAEVADLHRQIRNAKARLSRAVR